MVCTLSGWKDLGLANLWLWQKRNSFLKYQFDFKVASATTEKIVKYENIDK